jgi:hypothetical protein
LLLTFGVGWWRGWFSASSRSPVRQTNRATTNRPAH